MEPEPEAELEMMLVDDELDSMQTSINTLQRRGFIVQTARTKDAALNQFRMRRGKCCLVVTDIELDKAYPRDISGVHLAQEIRQIDPEIPIIGYSGKYSDDDLDDWTLKVFSDYSLRGVWKPAEVLAKYDHWRRVAETYRQNIEATSDHGLASIPNSAANNPGGPEIRLSPGNAEIVGVSFGILVAVIALLWSILRGNEGGVVVMIGVLIISIITVGAIVVA